jgi:hypothetical protein
MRQFWTRASCTRFLQTVSALSVVTLAAASPINSAVSRSFVATAGAGAGEVGLTALTPAQAQQLVSQKLAAAYGTAWRDHTPKWSEPECRQVAEGGSPPGIRCSTEFAYAGVWRGVGAMVDNDGTVTLQPGRSWVRRWRPEPAHEALPGGGEADCTTPKVEGHVFSNDGGCYALTLYQNFGGSTIVRYTGFKRHIYSYATLSALWPDFNGYTCTWSKQTYQCINRFGDGFRWKPYASNPSVATSAEFWSPSRNVSCHMGANWRSATEVFCRSAKRDLSVALSPDGRLYICRSNCLGFPSKSAPSLAYGKQITVGGFRCLSLQSGMKCTMIRSGTGFLITSTTVSRVGP